MCAWCLWEGLKAQCLPPPSQLPAPEKVPAMEFSQEKPNLTQMASQQVWGGLHSGCECGCVPVPVWHYVSLSGGPRLWESHVSVTLCPDLEVGTRRWSDTGDRKHVALSVRAREMSICSSCPHCLPLPQR